MLGFLLGILVGLGLAIGARELLIWLQDKYDL